MRILDDFTNCENGVRLDGKVAIVTGATSGTGLETAKNLAKRGAKVIIASRSPAKLSDARKNIIKSSGNGNVVARTMDFESLKSVRNFAQEMYLSEPRLDILINNIGAIALEDRLTSDNLHLMMQVNYFGAFLLTFLLYPLMKSSAPSRIVNVSSMALLLGHIDFEHMNDVGKSTFEYYANAKLAEILFTVEMHNRIEGNGVNIYSMDPGLGKSEFFRNSNVTFWKTVLNTGLLIVGRPLDRVATMPVFLAVDPRFFSNNKVLTKRLWEESKRLVRITPEEDWERF
ncbi:retinol dehydrogenase 13-like [Vanessa atalanta]|uniref:retinol dehydrogenase 13-like n=1 Tax=Vanessa atalanta TaxID=42275 RepID=UPI001FCD7898|nr:retinol dehydrogenase 13-like [Vanessa atalanta]